MPQKAERKHSYDEVRTSQEQFWFPMKDYQSCSTFQREAESNLYKRFDNIIADEFSQLFLMSAKKLLAPALGR